MTGSRRRGWLTVLALLAAALAPRLPDLGRFLTSDERTNIVIAGSDVIAAFLRGDLAQTYWHFYPGVTLSWLDAFGLGGGWLVRRLSGAAPPFLEYIYSDLVKLLVPARVPYALLAALFVPLFYLAARRLLDERTALVGALLIAWEPFFVAHSRVAHGDAPLTVFMALSVLALFVYLKGRSRRWLVFSAAMGALAALTKAPGHLLAPFVIGVAAIDFLGARLRGKGGQGALLDAALWGLVALALFIALWPAMWVEPLGTLARMLDETFGKVNEGHLVFFMGRPTLDPGPWFYLYVIPFRLSPVTAAGLGVSVAVTLYFLIRWPGLGAQERAWLRVVGLIWLFVVLMLLFGNLSPKKQDRYLLPLFPLLCLLAAFGYVRLLEGLASLRRAAGRALVVGGLLALAAVQGLTTWWWHPYQLAYFNPLMGGLPRAVQTTLVGWGEGMEQVAEYLNRKEGAAELFVAAVPAQTLLPYFAGSGANFYTNDVALRADYAVLYISQVQRLAPSPEIVAYFLAQPPEKVVTIKGTPYAWLYRGPKLILAEMPAGVTPVNAGFGDALRLGGYRYEEGEGSVLVRLYWQVLAPPEHDYSVSLRLVGIDGGWLAQHDSMPAGGLIRTGELKPGDIFVDEHRISDIEPAHVSALQVVVYEAASGLTLPALGSPEPPALNIPLAEGGL